MGLQDINDCGHALVILGYFEISRAQHQLVTPLIPPGTAYEIIYHQSEEVITVSSIWAGIFLAGLWLYSFNKKRPAVIVFSILPIWYLLANLVR